jgi:hypothetical protein
LGGIDPAFVSDNVQAMACSNRGAKGLQPNWIEGSANLRNIGEVKLGVLSATRDRNLRWITRSAGSSSAGSVKAGVLFTALLLSCAVVGGASVLAQSIHCDRMPRQYL